MGNFQIFINMPVQHIYFMELFISFFFLLTIMELFLGQCGFLIETFVDIKTVTGFFHSMPHPQHTIVTKRHPNTC